MYVCAAQGFPAPTVTWYYNGAALSPLHGVRVLGFSLMVSDPQLNHLGIYQCVAKNTYNGETREATKVWMLEVRVPSKQQQSAFISCKALMVKRLGLRMLWPAENGKGILHLLHAGKIGCIT